MNKTDLLKTVWVASAIAAVFTQSGVLCLVPAAFITFVAFVTE